MKRWDLLSRSDQLKLHLKANIDPCFFMENEYFNDVKLFPKQREAIRTIYDMKALGKLYEIILAWGRRAGKTFIGSQLLSYGLYQLLQMSNPQKRFGLAPRSPIELDAVAKSGKQAKRTAFRHMRARVRSNPYYVHLEETGQMIVLTEEIRCPNEIYVYSLNSNAGASVGGTCWMVLFEELVKFDEGETSKSAGENYETLTAATGTLAEFGAYSIVLSSIEHEEDIVMQLVRQAKLSPTMYAEIAPTWVINPRLPFEGDYIQNKLRNSKNPGKFWREYGCIPERGGKMYVGNKGIFKREGITWNCLDTNWLAYLYEYNNQFPTKEFRGEIESIVNIEEALKIPIRMKPDPNIANLPHVIAGDPAQTGDSFGLCLGTLVEFPYFYNQQKDRIFYADGIFEFEPNIDMMKLAKKQTKYKKQVVSDGAVSPNDVLKLIMLARAHFNIMFAVFDTWDYPMIQEKLMNAGIIVLRNTVKLQHYDGLLDRAHAGALRMVNFKDNLVLDKELLKLIRKGDKIVPPGGFSKDGSDAVANCNWVLAEFFEKRTKAIQPTVVAIV